MDTLEQVVLVEPSEEFETEFLAMLNELRDAGDFVFDEEVARVDFHTYVQALIDQSQGIGLDPGVVPMSTFWLIDRNRDILGEVRLRHQLTPALTSYGGHIGYIIRPSQRRKGYGARILAMTLEKARARGIQRVRLTCDTENIASARIIERNGGILSGFGTSPVNGKQTSQYWIEL